ncbi:MAG: hypothetical protein IPM24_14975 [Bryobacterales bacterium]|nr:hypothetical protein [Bryobacterales bacterium]
MTPVVRVAGAGPAGSAAALSALRAGCPVEIAEKARFPRHKVCGEFLSPEAASVLEDLGCASAFTAARPARIERARLVFGRSEKRFGLPDPAHGLSRYTLDQLLLQQAIQRGAHLLRDSAGASVIAHGRQGRGEKGNRLFGFKAHFRGPVNDTVELFFFDRGYVGVSAIENGGTNVCGLAPEALLSAHGFEIDAVLARAAALRERLAPLTRSMDWMVTGPLVFSRTLESMPEGVYAAGDALGFIDPFTGSGILAALATGRIAGRSAAGRISQAEHLLRCNKALRAQYRSAALARLAIETGLADLLARFVPGRLLFALTRPSVA